MAETSYCRLVRVSMLHQCGHVLCGWHLQDGAVLDEAGPNINWRPELPCASWGLVGLPEFQTLSRIRFHKQDGNLCNSRFIELLRDPVDSTIGRARYR